MNVAIRQVVEMHRPLGPDQPRPDGRPKYIRPTCQEPGCGRPLQLCDELDGVPPSQIWHDEWECPVHRGVLIDHPTERVASA